MLLPLWGSKVTDLATDCWSNSSANSRHAPSDEGLTGPCERVEALAPDSIAGLTICNPARTHIERALFPKLPEFAAAIKSIPLSPSDFGSCVRAVARGEVITCSDIQEENRFDPQWRRLCLDHGIRALQSRPVYLRDRKAYATFVLAYREPREETNWNVALMNFAADASGLIIQSDFDRLDEAAE
jgi:GAF domain-containing protein